MPQSEFEQFAAQVLALRLQRNAAVLSEQESELLLKINQGLPAALQHRYNDLIAKRDAGSLTSEEYTELLHLTDQVEQREAERLEYLAALAGLRQTTLTQLMSDLGIKPLPMTKEHVSAELRRLVRARQGVLRVLP
jgi:hypothetical protein